jgi:hypothetical protein
MVGSGRTPQFWFGGTGGEPPGAVPSAFPKPTVRDIVSFTNCPFRRILSDSETGRRHFSCSVPRPFLTLPREDDRKAFGEKPLGTRIRTLPENSRRPVLILRFPASSEFISERTVHHETTSPQHETPPFSAFHIRPENPARTVPSTPSSLSMASASSVPFALGAAYRYTAERPLADNVSPEPL